ncbi:MAG: Glu/Leu/Phe/Val dehydrogenase [Peptoniphilaceae bacterium]|nr:Glu/Leu/Phe/Val dehydrogenase [Peptoniphilaceae bacterium]MDY6018108.1 Glu/Leu/Phe/Val dehydrogenase [Anaerococcus sp.]
MAETLNILESARLEIKKACNLLKLNPACYDILKDPLRVMETSLPVKMDDGSTKVFKAYRSAHNWALGPCKGGVRFHENVSLDEVKALSMWMSLKAGLLNIPYGGGKGGICTDPSELSDREIENLSRAYIRSIYKYLGERIDIPAPDMNTNGKVMSYFLDEYEKLNGEKQDIGTFTGKPLVLGGSLGRNEATGFGVVVATKFACQKLDINLADAKIGIQGFGNVGSFSLKYLLDNGAKIQYLCIHDRKSPSGLSGLYSKEGFSYEQLSAYYQDHKTLVDFPNAVKISDTKFWSEKFDILIPAAIENSITSEIAKKIQVKLIVEGANGPITPEADEILKDNNVVIIPDILANSGGVLVSYYEWVQNQYGYYWDIKEVQEKQEKDMQTALKRVFETADKYQVSIREAAYITAIKRIDEAMQLRGWY